MRGKGEEEDMISQLPEHLIIHILSLLPTKDVITTTVLSKRWKHLWKMVPNLMFDYCDHKLEPGSFSKDVCKILASHKAPILESFHLEVDLATCTATDIGILLGMAVGRNVRELYLDVYPENKKKDRSFVFPTSLLYTCEALETLILRFLVLVELPSQICLKSLKTLHLEYINYQDQEDSVISLLSACPCLQNLVLKRTPYSDSIKTFTIAVQSLQTLLIHDENDSEDHPSYLISAPLLKNLHIEVDKGNVICLIQNSPELVKAEIICETIDPNLMLSLTSVKTLSLLLWSPLEVKYRSRRKFSRLVHLEIYTCKPSWWNLLTIMLKNSPKLKVLKLLVNHWRETEDNVVCDEWNQPDNVPECLLFHLETFVWEGYKGKGDEEKEVAAYVLRNASRLKKATFVRVKRDKLKELKRMARASKSCHLVLKTLQSR